MKKIFKRITKAIRDFFKSDFWDFEAPTNFPDYYKNY